MLPDAGFPASFLESSWLAPAEELPEGSPCPHTWGLGGIPLAQAHSISRSCSPLHTVSLSHFPLGGYLSTSEPLALSFFLLLPFSLSLLSLCIWDSLASLLLVFSAFSFPDPFPIREAPPLPQSP